VAVALGGWKALRWSWQPILFLGFMAPLPYRLQNTLGGSLQAIATRIGTYALQVFGVPAISEGNVILVNDVKIGIVEACSGLGMLVTFFALAAALVFLLRSLEPWLKCVIVLSAPPVAILANVIRITVTGFLYSISRDDWAHRVFHDGAGWLMMPLAIGMLFAEIHILKKLIIDRPTRSMPKAVAVVPGLRRKQKSPVVR
jgi:exosortase